MFGPRRRILDCVSLFCCSEAKKTFLLMFGFRREEPAPTTYPLGYPLWENVGFSGRAKPARIHGMLCYVWKSGTHRNWNILNNTTGSEGKFIILPLVVGSPPWRSIPTGYTRRAKHQEYVCVCVCFTTAIRFSTSPNSLLLCFSYTKTMFFGGRWWSVSVTWLNMLLGWPPSVFVFCSNCCSGRSRFVLEMPFFVRSRKWRSPGINLCLGYVTFGKKYV